MNTGSRTDINKKIRREHRFHVMFDNNDSISKITECN